MRLDGKKVLITGGTSGIGRSIAEAFAREGACVAISGQNTERGHQVVREIAKAGGETSFLKADISSVDQVRYLAQAAMDTLGRVDILVNNAGIYFFIPTVETDEATFDKLMNTNVKGPFFLTAALVPGMIARGKGKIINVSSMVAERGTPFTAAYGATKSALTLLTKAWATEYGPHGINVNALMPGIIETPGTMDNEGLKQHASFTPARRVGQPEEVAAAAIYLASEESNFLHGTILAVDGGGSAGS